MIIDQIKLAIREHLDSIPDGKIPLIVILGPTAVGKTALSIGICKEFNGEVISADSRQVYKGMDIGTDKITEEEMQRVKHYMLNQVEPYEDFTVYDFKKLSNQFIEKIYSNGNIPFIVGGTMMYIDAVVNGFDFGKVKPNYELRTFLYSYIDKNSKEKLHLKLQELVPEIAAKIHPNNTHYLVRAIERNLTEKTNVIWSDLSDNFWIKVAGFIKNSKHNENASSKIKPDQSCTKYHVLKIGLMRPREELYGRINKRVDEQLKDGKLEKEAQYFLEKYPNERSITGLGYRQFKDYFAKTTKKDGELFLLSDVANLLKKQTRNFAKRQLTWWRKDNSIIWFDIK